MLTLTLTPELHGALAAAAKAAGRTIESLAIDAIAEHVESAIRYRALVERMEVVDQALIDIASLVGEMTAANEAAAGAGGSDLATLCRYKTPGR